ncbi:hypothetical protein [Glutamicibacter sp. 2E12]|uniref:hypothetical protein n=1 Tax=Glutamicibacter sp. 2E12 TaxID=3416181 RepID=UPI003CF24736
MKDFFQSLSKRAFAILIAIVVLILIAVPTALMSGLLSSIFDSPAEGIRVFFIMVGAGAVLLVCELFVEEARERRQLKKRALASGKKK